MTSTMRVTADPRSWTGTSSCGRRALGGDVDGWRLGLGVLQQRGVAAWLRVRQAAVAERSRRPRPPGLGLARRRGRGRPSWSGCSRRWRWLSPRGGERR